MKRKQFKLECLFYRGKILASQGMAEFAANSGRARWVTSPILSESDWEALQEGSAARLDETLKMAMEVNLHNLRTSMEKHTFWE